MKNATWIKGAPLALAAAALLAACGGGGGGAGSDGGSDALAGAQGRNLRADQNHGAEVREIATDLTQRGVGLDRSRLAHLVEVAQSKRPAAGAAAAAMVSLTYNGPASWFRRVLSTSATQSVPDRDGWIRTWDRRERMTFGQHATWSFGSEPARQSDVHWNGNAWVRCALNHEIASTPVDADGANQYNYCDGYELGTGQRSFLGIEGRTMLEVYQAMRSAGATNVFIANTSVLGSAVFPAGSMLVAQTNTATQTAVAYYPGIGNAVRDPIPALAAADPATCLSIGPNTPLRDYTTFSTSLEGMVATHRGIPCVFTPTALTGPRNEWWTQATVPIGFLPSNLPPGPYYTGGTMLRASFPGGNAITFHACQHRLDGSTRNCNPIGSGTFSIETLGDARAMRLGTLPPQIAALAWVPLFVERAGKVWVAYQNKPVATSTARLNLPALNALATQLGLPAVDPAVPLATTPASFQGQWVLGVAGTLDAQDTMTLSIFPTPQGLGASCIEDKSNTSLDCSTFGSFDADGNFTLLTRNDHIVGRFLFVEGTASGTLFPPPGSTAPIEPMEGVRR
ncbi:MAG TPA: hypothetical protein VGD76_04980 [Ramlibacter sp.]